MNGRNGCKIVGLRRARTQQPTCGRNPGEHRVGGATGMGSRDQCRPLQYFIEIQIQSQPLCGFYPRSTAHTCHSGRHAIPKESEGAGRIGGHVQSGD